MFSAQVCHECNCIMYARAMTKFEDKIQSNDEHECDRTETGTAKLESRTHRSRPFCFVRYTHNEPGTHQSHGDPRAVGVSSHGLQKGPLRCELFGWEPQSLNPDSSTQNRCEGTGFLTALQDQEYNESEEDDSKLFKERVHKVNGFTWFRSMSVGNLNKVNCFTGPGRCPWLLFRRTAEWSALTPPRPSNLEV